MAIKNASDLLVYKTVPSATAQVTRIRIIQSSPLNVNGTVKIINSANSSGTNVAEIETSVTGNTGESALYWIQDKLTPAGYTVGATITDGDYRYMDFTNTYAGDLTNTLSIAAGTSTIDEGAITVTVITSGLDAGQEPIAYSTSASISFSADLRDVTTKDSLGWSQSLGGLKSFELSTDALVDFDADLDFQEFWNDYKDLTEVTVRFAERATGGSSERYWQGNAYVTSLSLDAGVEENATYSVSFTGTAVATTGED